MILSAAMIRYSKPFLLSANGSNRGTAYYLANKIITDRGLTHVVWTDTIARTCGRTYDHSSRTWGATMTIGEGCDNHNNPCLAMDAGGRLHIAYGPHGTWDRKPLDTSWPSGAFRYAVANKPGTLDGLDHNKDPFGYRATYAALVCLPNGRDAIVYRGGEHPPALMFQMQTDKGGWTQARPLMCIDTTPQYTFYGPMIACDKCGRIYVAGSLYVAERGHALGAMVLMSADYGKTWTGIDGQHVETPVEYTPRLAIPHPEPLADPRVCGLAIDSRGTPWFLTLSQRGRIDTRLMLSCWRDGRWHMRNVAPLLPPGRIATVGGLSIDIRDGLHIVVSGPDLSRTTPESSLWAHPSSAVFHLYSRDAGATFECHQVSNIESPHPCWLPQIGRPGLFNTVDKPVILFTHGPSAGKPGEACRSTNLTEIYAVLVEEIN